MQSSSNILNDMKRQNHKQRDKAREREREREREPIYAKYCGRANAPKDQIKNIERERERKGERGEREEKIILYKNKDLSTSWLFYKSVPDGKHSNTQYIKQEYE